VCEQDNSKSYGRIFLWFWGYVGHGTNYQWLNVGGDPAGIVDSGSLWNFRYRCIKGGIRELLAKRRWRRHLANSFALVEVPAGYDCYLVSLCVCVLHVCDYFVGLYDASMYARSGFVVVILAFALFDFWLLIFCCQRHLFIYLFNIKIVHVVHKNTKETS